MTTANAKDYRWGGGGGAAGERAQGTLGGGGGTEARSGRGGVSRELGYN